MKGDLLEGKLKKALHNVNLPPIDVRSHVMEKINQKERKDVMPNTKKLVYAILISAILLFAVGYSVVTILDLQGPGNTNYQYKIVDEPSTFPSQEVYYDQYEAMPPGHMLAIMRVRNNENQTVNMLLKPYQLTELASIAHMVGSRFIKPNRLPEGFFWKEGNVSFEPIDYKTDIVREMDEERKSTSEDYVIRVIEPTDTISGYSLTYSSKGTEMIFHVTLDWPGDEILNVKEYGARAKKVRVKDFEAVYVEQAGRGELIWLERSDEDRSTYYNISMMNASSSTLDDLILVAENLR